jgi:hypothetical protein
MTKHFCDACGAELTESRGGVTNRFEGNTKTIPTKSTAPRNVIVVVSIQEGSARDVCVDCVNKALKDI